MGRLKIIGSGCWQIALAIVMILLGPARNSPARSGNGCFARGATRSLLPRDRRHRGRRRALGLLVPRLASPSASCWAVVMGGALVTHLGFRATEAAIGEPRVGESAAADCLGAMARRTPPVSDRVGCAGGAARARRHVGQTRDVR